MATTEQHADMATHHADTADTTRAPEGTMLFTVGHEVFKVEKHLLGGISFFDDKIRPLTLAQTTGDCNAEFKLDYQETDVFGVFVAWLNSGRRQLQNVPNDCLFRVYIFSEVIGCVSLQVEAADAMHIAQKDDHKCFLVDLGKMLKSVSKSYSKTVEKAIKDVLRKVDNDADGQKILITMYIFFTNGGYHRYQDRTMDAIHDAVLTQRAKLNLDQIDLVFNNTKNSTLAPLRTFCAGYLSSAIIRSRQTPIKEIAELFKIHPTLLQEFLLWERYHEPGLAMKKALAKVHNLRGGRCQFHAHGDGKENCYIKHPVVEDNESEPDDTDSDDTNSDDEDPQGDMEVVVYDDPSTTFTESGGY